MMPPLVILRPEPGAGASLQSALALGLDAWAFPLFVTAPRDWAPPPPDAFDALLLGSANALRHGGEALALYAGKPAYCVGKATAREASAHGLIVAARGQGGLQAMLDMIAPGHTRLLRLAGEERVVLDPPPGLSLDERVVYASMPVAMPVELARVLCVHAFSRILVMLHSGAAARHFIEECTRLKIDLSRLTAICIGPRVSEICRESNGWHDIITACAPNDAAMLALARQTCQSGAGLDGGLAGQ